MLIGNFGNHVKLRTDVLFDQTAWLPYNDELRVPEVLKTVAGRYLENMQDLLYIVTAPQAMLTYILACKGAMKPMEKIDWTPPLHMSHSSDDEYEWLHSYVSGFCHDWLSVHGSPLDSVESAIVDTFERKGWPTAIDRAWCRTVVVLAWSAFEAMAADLWIEVVNARPEPLLHRALDEQKVNIGDLKKFIAMMDDNLAGVVQRKMGMKSLDGIRSAFIKILGASAIPCLEGNEGKLLLKLEKTRHLIVHRGGLVDAEFLKAMQMTITAGSALPLNLDGVCEMANGAMMAGRDLIMTVCRWFGDNA